MGFHYVTLLQANFQPLILCGKYALIVFVLTLYVHIYEFALMLELILVIQIYVT